MAFDSLCLTAEIASLKSKIIGSKITRIYQPDRFSIILKLYGNNGGSKLLLSAHPERGRIHLTNESSENPATPPMFCMVLRKHLENGRISDIRQRAAERVAELYIDATDEIGNPTKRCLILEIMGKHSNLILIDGDTGIILDGIRRYSHGLSRHREVLPGKPYIAPPATNKVLIEQIDESYPARIAYEGNHKNAVQMLYQNIDGISPFLAQEILTRANLSEIDIKEYGEYEFHRLFKALKAIDDIKNQNNFELVLLKTEDGYYDYYPIIPQQANPANLEKCSSIDEMLDFYYQVIRNQNSFRSKLHELQKIVNTESNRLQKKIALQESDYADTVNAEKYKNMGDLLTTHLHRLQKGMEEIELPDFTDPDHLIKIKLQPDLAPMDNVKRFYRKYNKAKHSQHQIEEQLNHNRDELEYVESLALELDQAKDLTDLALIREELAESGYIKKAKSQKAKNGKKTKKSPEIEQPPLEFRSEDGFTILVGRNNKQNDKLTLKLAKKNDIWLHTQKIPGSHVIIKAEPQREISETALLTAAKLAAAHSKARLSAQVPVDYTRVSQVKKPNGAKPGMVIYFQQKTLYVTPTDLPEELEKLD